MAESVRPTRGMVGIASVIAAGLVVTSFTGTSRAATGSAASVVTVTGHGVASAYDSITLYAGSPTQAAYGLRRTQLGLSLGSDYGSGKSRPVMMVRAESGKTISLGAMSKRVQFGQLSTMGKWLVAWESSDLSVHSPIVEVWNLKTRSHRLVHLTKAALWLQATPAGFVYTFGKSLREWVASTNSYRSWGTPFPKQRIASVVADDRGVLVTGVKSGAKLMTYSHPGAYKTIRTDKGSYSCQALNHTGAGCRVDAPYGGVGYLSLTGGTPVTASTPGFSVEGVVLAGREVLYAASDSDEGSPDLFGFSVADPTPVKSPTAVSDMIAAYGKALLTHAGDGTQVLSATDPTSASKLFSVPRSSDVAGAFSLTSGRVAYVSDLRNPNDPAQTLSVQSVNLGVSSGHLTVGPLQQVAGRSGDLQVTTDGRSNSSVAAIPTATAYVRTGGHAYVTTAAGTAELPGSFAAGGTTLEAAGHRVLATSLGNGGLIELFDTETDAVQDLSSLSAERPISFALTPSSLVYGTYAGQVRRLDLNTGLTTTIFAAPGTLGSHRPTVYATDNWVAWDVESSGGGKSVHTEGMRSVGQTLGPVVTLPHIIFGISDAGVLLYDLESSTSYALKTWLRPFNGKIRTLLSPRQYESLPQLADGVLAWVDGGGDLKAERYSS